MAKLKIVEWPAKVLETKALPVEVFDAQFKAFTEDMLETMLAEQGIGLAANQVGVLKRVIVIRIDRQRDDQEPQRPWHDKTFVLVNPEIIEKSSVITKGVEGCLSFPGIYDYVPRYDTVVVKAQDVTGEEYTVEADGLFSACLQHEIDHIDGIVFTTRMSRLKASRIRKKLQTIPRVSAEEA